MGILNRKLVDDLLRLDSFKKENKFPRKRGGLCDVFQLNPLATVSMRTE